MKVTVNGQPRELPSGATVASVIELLDVKDLTAAEVVPSLASPEDFAKAGVDRQATVGGEVERRAALIRPRRIRRIRIESYNYKIY